MAAAANRPWIDWLTNKYNLASDAGREKFSIVLKIAAVTAVAASVVFFTLIPNAFTFLLGSSVSFIAYETYQISHSLKAIAKQTAESMNQHRFQHIQEANVSIVNEIENHTIIVGALMKCFKVNLLPSNVRVH